MKVLNLALAIAAVLLPLGLGCPGEQASQPSAPLKKAEVPEYGPDGFDIRTGRDRQGYDRNGFNSAPKPLHKDTGTPFNPNGFNIHGFNRFGEDKDGALDPNIKYEANGFNQYGFDRFGFNDQGRYVRTGEERDPEGYDAKGFDKKGYDRKGLDEYGFDQKHIHSITGTPRDEKGYDWEGYDEKGFARSGKHRDTGTLFNKAGFDRDGFDRRGFDKDGFHKSTGTHRDPQGYNKEGYDRMGYTREGFNKDGVDKFGRPSFYKLATDVISVKGAKLEDEKRAKIKHLAFEMLKKIAEWFGINDKKPKTIFRRLTMQIHPDKCINPPENFDNVIKLTQGKGFPNEAKRCSDLFNIARELSEMAQ